MRNRSFRERTTAMMLAVTMILSNTALPSLASEQIGGPAASVVEAETNVNDASMVLAGEKPSAETPAVEASSAETASAETASEEAPGAETPSDRKSVV